MWRDTDAPRLGVAAEANWAEFHAGVRGSRGLIIQSQNNLVDDLSKQIVVPPGPAGCGNCDVLKEPNILKKVPGSDVIVPPYQPTECGQCVLPNIRTMTPDLGLPQTNKGLALRAREHGGVRPH